MKNQSKILSVLTEYALLTAATVVMAVGIYFFRFPNNFSFGGISALAVILAKFLPLSAGTLNLLMNIVLLALGLIVLGRGFGIKTIYVSLLLSGLISLGEKIFPMDTPFTDEPLLELIFAIVIPAIASALFFNRNASSGGTDIIAMILSKYTTMNVTTALLLADAAVAVSAFWVFGVETGLYSVCGLLAKSLVIDGVIENINLCKVFTIICDNPDPISDYILNTLHRGVTTYKAMGGYRHEEKTVIITIMRRGQAIELRNFIRKNEPKAFIAISNSSEIIGKGFHAPMN